MEPTHHGPLSPRSPNKASTENITFDTEDAFTQKIVTTHRKHSRPRTSKQESHPNYTRPDIGKDTCQRHMTGPRARCTKKLNPRVKAGLTKNWKEIEFLDEAGNHRKYYKAEGVSKIGPCKHGQTFGGNIP